MNKRLVVFLLLTITVFFSCKKTTTTTLPDLTKSEISAKRLWDRFTKEENYKKYPTWPNHKGFQPGRTPHGRLHRAFINSILYNALPISDKIAPVGSMIVKENYTSEKEFVAFTVMVKVDGYDSENNDWFWAKYDKDGGVLAEGKVKACIDCHIATRNNDYMILWQLDKKVEK